MGKTTKLKGMTWDHPRGYACLEAVSKEFADRTGASIHWDRRSLQAFADASIDRLAQDCDLIVLDHPHVGVISESGCLLPLDGCVTEMASLGGSRESYVWRDQLWAVPIDAACQVAVKRPDLCKRELPSWEAAFDAPPEDYRLVTPLLPIDAFDTMLTLIAGRGEEALPHSAIEFVSETNGMPALDVLKALYRLGPAEALSWNPIDVLEVMSDTDDFAYSPCLFGYINYARPGYRAHRLHYTGLPSFAGSTVKRGILGGAGIGVSACSRDTAAAREFAAWVASAPVQSGSYLESGGQPAHPLAWDAMRDDPRYSGFLHGARSTMETAWTRPRDPWFLGFVDEVCAAFPGFFAHGRDTADFLREINEIYRRHKSQGE